MYYLLKGIFYGLYKLFEGIYHLIFGKKETKEELQEVPVHDQVVIHEKTPDSTVQKSLEPVPAGVSFCSECGSKYTDTMFHQLTTKGTAYCVHCGTGFKAENARIES